MSRSARSGHEPSDSRLMFFSIISSASRTGTSRAIPSVRQSAVIFSESDIGAETSIECTVRPTKI